MPLLSLTVASIHLPGRIVAFVNPSNAGALT